jgi:hypothetical protein
MNSPRSRPSPCSPESEPRYFFTRWATSVAIPRKNFPPAWVRRVEERAGVQLAGAGVGVIDAADAVFAAHQRVELGDVGRQVLDGHRRVLDHLARLRVARERCS